MDTFPLISQKSELKMGTVTAIYSYIFGQSISLLLQFIYAAVRCFWCELVARSFVHWEYDWNYICSEFCLIQKSRYWRCYLAREDAARPRISDSSDSAAHRNWPDYFSYARFGPLFLFKLGVLRFNHKNGACLFLSVSLCVTKSSPGPWKGCTFHLPGWPSSLCCSILLLCSAVSFCALRTFGNVSIPEQNFFS